MGQIISGINRIILGIAELMEREAGYHMISLALIVTGMVFTDTVKRTELAHDLVVFGTGVMARSMTSKKTTQVPPQVTP